MAYITDCSCEEEYDYRCEQEAMLEAEYEYEQHLAEVEQNKMKKEVLTAYEK